MRTWLLALLTAAVSGCSVMDKMQVGCASKAIPVSQLWTKDSLPESDQQKVTMVTQDGWQRLAVDQCRGLATTDASADDTNHEGDPTSGTRSGDGMGGGTTNSGGSNQLVVFRIADGTGNGPWNTAETSVRVKVNDTLRVCNDDSNASAKKRMHANGRPFAHGNSDIAPGECKDYLIRQATNANDRVYNHHVGTSARLFITATP